jgi:lipopolysaccharide export system protein LptA
MSKTSPVRITSDRVDSDQNGRWVNFTGDVQATQDDGTIWADSLKVYYKPAEEESVGSGSIEKMIAEGNVKIVFDGESKTAVAQKAVYTTVDGILVLTGGNPKVWSGKNFVQGSRITLFQKEGRTVVEGNETDRVEATFYTEEKGGLIK